jgi:translation initiation factor IF-1
MSKTDVIKVEGTILEANGNSRYKVQLATGQEIRAMLSGKMRMNFIKVIVGDTVEVELSPYDITNGRISRRIRQKNEFNNPRPTVKKRK